MTRKSVVPLLVVSGVVGLAFYVGQAGANLPRADGRASQSVPQLVFESGEATAQEDQWTLLIESQPIVVDAPATVIADARVVFGEDLTDCFDGSESELRLEPVGGEETALDNCKSTSYQVCDYCAPHFLGHGHVLEAGQYVFRVYVMIDHGNTIAVNGWLRLQIFRAEVTPGDLDLDGDVDLSDFNTFAVNFTGPGG